MDQKWCSGQRRPGGRQLPYSETVLYAERVKLYLNKDGIVACTRREEDKVRYKYNAIVLPQLYQTELLFRSHDQMGHQGIDKAYQRILKRFEWPGMKKTCEKWVKACLSCQQVRDSRKLRFLLQSIESSKFNEVVQIDHQKICMTDSSYASGADRASDFVLGKNGLHEGRSNFNEHQIGGRQPWSNLRGRKDTNNGPTHGSTQSLDELLGG